MSGPLSDEQITEIKKRIERGREGIVFPLRPTTEDMAALLDEVERLKAENGRLKKELAEAVKYHDKLIEDLTRLIPEEYDTDAAAEAIVVQWAEDQIEAWAKIREAHQPCPFGPGEGCKICEVLDGGEG